VFVTNHVLSGAVIGQMLKRRPAAAFVVGVGSHLLLDMCPHWGCDTKTPQGQEEFLKVAKRDGLLGLTAMAIAAVLAGSTTRTATISAMLGAVFLDVDKVCIHFFGVNPFPDAVDRIHRKVQNESPKGLPNELAYGAAFGAINMVMRAGADGDRDHCRMTAGGAHSVIG
jgi:hypothetical protein